jgi:hypothetical protein
VKVGDAFSSVSDLLGGSGEERRGKPDIASRVKMVDAVLDFAEGPSDFEVARHKGSEHQRQLGHERPRRGSKFV